jgi:hypothetical protein
MPSDATAATPAAAAIALSRSEIAMVKSPEFSTSATGLPAPHCSAEPLTRRSRSPQFL